MANLAEEQGDGIIRLNPEARARLFPCGVCQGSVAFAWSLAINDATSIASPSETIRTLGMSVENCEAASVWIGTTTRG